MTDNDQPTDDQPTDDQPTDRSAIVTRFFDDIWNDADMAFGDDPDLIGAVLADDYRPGYHRTLHWGWRLNEERSAGDWLASQVEAYRTEYPDFEMRINRLLVDGHDAVTEIAFTGTHATETFINRGGTASPVTRVAQGIGWTRFVDDRIVRHGFFWDGGNFLGRDI